MKEIGLAVLDENTRALVDNPDELARLLDEMEIGAENVEDMRRRLNEARPRLAVDQKYALGVSLKLTEAVVGQLLDMNWCLCDAPSGRFFITSDTPLNVFMPHEGGTASFGGGLGEPAVEVRFPVSPTVCLALDRRHTAGRRRVGRKFVDETNRRTAWMAERFVVSPFKTRLVSQLVEQSSGTRETPRIDTKSLLSAFRQRR